MSVDDARLKRLHLLAFLEKAFEAKPKAFMVSPGLAEGMGTAGVVAKPDVLFLTE